MLSFVGCSLWVRHAYDNQSLGDTVRTTVITVGNSIRLRNIDFQNLSTTSGGNVTVAVDTLEPSVQFSTYSGQMRWDTATSKLQFSNDDGATWADIGASGETVYRVNTSLQFGNTSGMLRYDGANMQYSNNGGSAWSNIGSGSGEGETMADYALVFPHLTTPPLTFIRPFSQDDIYDPVLFRIVIFANLSTVASPSGSLFRLNDTEDTECDLIDFGITESPYTPRLYAKVATLLSFENCQYVNFSSIEISNYQYDHVNAWREYALQGITEEGVTFYLNGNALSNHTTLASFDNCGEETLDYTVSIFDGIKGRAGELKFGRQAPWPTSGWKGFSLEGRLFTGLQIFLPLSEGEGNPREVMLNITSVSKDAAITWEEVEGGY